MKMIAIISRDLHEGLRITFLRQVLPINAFVSLVLAMGASVAYADVYKCIVNGKTVYSDSRCAYRPDVVKVDPNQNIVQGDRSTVKNDVKTNTGARSNDPKCAQLLDRLRYARTIGDMDKYSKEYEFRCVAPRSADPKCTELLGQLSHVRTRGDLNRASQAYELLCMSPGDRERSAQNRDNQEMQRKLNDIQRTQQEIQLRQRGIGY